MNEIVEQIAAAGPWAVQAAERLSAPGRIVLYRMQLLTLRSPGDTRERALLEVVVVMEGDLQTVDFSVIPVEWNGRPPNHQERGAHWLRLKRNGLLQLMEWSELSATWSYFGVSGTDIPSLIAKEMTYIGPSFPPDPTATAG
jgi:hypothetical protein